MHRFLFRANLIQRVAETMDRDMMRRDTGRPVEEERMDYGGFGQGARERNQKKGRVVDGR